MHVPIPAFVRYLTLKSSFLSHCSYSILTEISEVKSLLPISQCVGCIPMRSSDFSRYKKLSDPELMRIKLFPFEFTVNLLITRKRKTRF